MKDPKPPDRELLDLLRRIAAEDAPAVIERARSRARARAEELVEEMLVTELLNAAAGPASDSLPGARAGGESETPRAFAGRETRLPEPVLPESETGDAWWTYCILWDQDAVEVASRLEGLEPGSIVEAVCDGQLGALVSCVPLREYGDERLREHLEDLEWVERTARRHEAVLEAALEQTSIVPLRLCTLYRERDAVRRLLHEHEQAFRDGLARIEGSVEWGVKLFADTDGSVSEPLPEPAGETRGAAYLHRRQHERALAEKATEVRARCVEVVHQHFAALSRASAINPPQRPEVHGRESAMLLNGAYLVERNRRAELEQAVAGLREEWAPLGFHIELTGPWPPYNFVSGTGGVIS